MKPVLTFTIILATGESSLAAEDTRQVASLDSKWSIVFYRANEGCNQEW